MKIKFMKCDNCEEETKFTVRKTFSVGRRKLRREVSRCCSCGRTIVKNSRTKNTYIKKLGGRDEKSKMSDL